MPDQPGITTVSSVAGNRRGVFSRLRAGFSARITRLIPASLRNDPEEFRSAYLQLSFVSLGQAFGWVFILFYLVVGHYAGAGIVFLCTCLLLVSAWILTSSASTRISGHVQCLIFTLGFAAMTAVEGGIDGHAAAWLACAPLIALLALRRWEAIFWFGVALTILSGFIFLAGIDIVLVPTYPVALHFVITSMGMLALVGFFFLLGLAFEEGRREAQGKLVEALEDLAEANAALRRLNEEKNEFLGIVAHDLRNPLSTVLMAGELLERGIVKDKAVRDSLAVKIVKECSRMRRLIEDLLNVNRIESGTVTYQLSRVDLTSITEESVSQLEPSATKKKQTLRYARPEKVVILADPSALRQIVDNLISNAVKYSPPGAEILVGCSEEEDKVVWFVQDQGPGIRDEDRGRMFQKFARLSAEPTGGETSTGLGLAIVKRLVEELHGTIDCRNTPPVGARFEVNFKPAV